MPLHSQIHKISNVQARGVHRILVVFQHAKALIGRAGMGGLYYPTVQLFIVQAHVVTINAAQPLKLLIVARVLLLHPLVKQIAIYNHVI